MSFRWKDRAKGDAPRVETISGVEKRRRHGGVLDATSAASEARRVSSRGAAANQFVARYLRHVLPKGMRGVRHCGFCHPAAKAKRGKVAFLTGRPLLIGALAVPPPKPPPEPCKGPRCGGAMVVVRRIPAPWESARARPPPHLKPHQRAP